MEHVINGAEQGLMALRSTTWVSLLVHRGAVDRHGLPLKHYFIWSDDIEYTSRIILSGDLAYLVPTSVALHDTETAHTALSASPERFYYHVRNTLYMSRGPGRPRVGVNPSGMTRSSGVRSWMSPWPMPRRAESIPPRRRSSTFSTPAWPLAASPHR